MRIIFFMLGLLWSSCLFGQTYVDTIAYSHYSLGELIIGGNKNIEHGATIIKKKERRVKRLETHHRNFQTNLWDSTLTHFDLRGFERLKYRFQYSFKEGIDSVYIEDVRLSEMPFLFRVVRFYDKKGTADVVQYYENGQVDLEMSFMADTNDYQLRPIYDEDDNAWPPTPLYYDTIYRYEPIKHGWEYQYYKNGDLKLRQKWNYGLVDSLVEKYYENGQLNMLVHMDNGKMIGEVKSWYANGNLQEHYFYNNDGKPIGKCQSWFESGQPKRLMQYDNKGNRVDIWRNWYSNGVLGMETEFFDDEIIYHEYEGEQYPMNIKKRKKTVWYDNGNIKEISFLKEDYDHVDNYISYHRNGEVKVKGKYLENMYRLFIYQARKGIEFFTIEGDGIKMGNWRYYDKSGKLIAHHKYKFGQLQKLVKGYGLEGIEAQMELLEIPDPTPCDHYVEIDVDIDSFVYEVKTLCIKRQELFWADTFYNYIANDLDSTPYVFEIIDFEENAGKCNYKRFYPNGQLMADYFYGEVDWFLEEHREGSRVSATGYLIDVATQYYPNGKTKWKKTYQKYSDSSSEVIEITTYYENGQRKNLSYSRYYDEPKDWKTWYPDGTLKKQITYKYGDKDGKALKYSQNGILIEKFNYKKDKLHGKQFYYDKNGKLIKTEVYKKGILQK